MLLSLNDDCLRTIMESLVFNDQISMAHVCQRLKLIATEIWQHTGKEVSITREQFEYFDNHKEYFPEYIRCINDYVENLKFDKIDITYFDELKNIQFPNVHHLCLNMNFEESCNDSIEIIKNIFPKLISLELYGGFTGANLWIIENLQELNLDCCEDLQTKHFKKIFSKLKLKKLSLKYYGYNVCFDERINDLTVCKTLEEICIDDHHLIMIYKDLFQLKKLKKIICYTRDYITYLLEQIVKHFGSRLHTMIFEDSFWSTDEHCESVHKMIGLRRLIFYDDDVTNEQLRTIGEALGNTLEEFYYRKGRLTYCENYDGFLDIVRQCTNLKIFDLSGTNIDSGFVERVAKLIALNHGKRNEILLMRCYGTKITNKDLETINLPEKLKISFENKKLELQGSRFFQCEWNTQSDGQN